MGLSQGSGDGVTVLGRAGGPQVRSQVSLQEGGGGRSGEDGREEGAVSTEAGSGLTGL